MAYYSHHMQKRAETESKPADKPYYTAAAPGQWNARDLHGFVNPFGADSGLGNNLLYGAGGALLGYGVGSILDRLRGRRRGESGLGGIGALAGLGLGLGGRYFANSRLADEAQYFDNPEQYGTAAQTLSKSPEHKGTVEQLVHQGAVADAAINRTAWDSMFGGEAPKPYYGQGNRPVDWDWRPFENNNSGG
jgi:hypothetical protein